MEKLGYGYATTLANTTLDDAIAKTTEALKAEGFGVLTEIDVAATLKKKLDVDHRPYRILGACNPKLAHQALQNEPEIGLLLPCNVVVDQVEDGVVMVSVIDPKAMFQVVENDAVQPIADDVEQRLKRVLAALEG